MVWQSVVAEPTGGEGGAAFGKSSGSGAELESEGFVEPDTGALGEAVEFVDPMGGDGLDSGLLLEGPFKGLDGGEAAVGGALHGFGELETNEVAEALAVLEAEVVRGAGEFGEGEVDGWESCWVVWGGYVREEGERGEK